MNDAGKKARAEDTVGTEQLKTSCDDFSLCQAAAEKPGRQC
jgi:hypothetical protein